MDGKVDINVPIARNMDVSASTVVNGITQRQKQISQGIENNDNPHQLSNAIYGDINDADIPSTNLTSDKEMIDRVGNRTTNGSYQTMTSFTSKLSVQDSGSTFSSVIDFDGIIEEDNFN